MFLLPFSECFECLFEMAKYSVAYPSKEVSKIALSLKWHDNRRKTVGVVVDEKTTISAEDPLKMTQCCQLNQRSKNRLNRFINSAYSMLNTSATDPAELLIEPPSPLYLVRMMEIKCENSKLTENRLCEDLLNSSRLISQLMHDKEHLYNEITGLHAMLCATEIKCVQLRLTSENHAASVATLDEKLRKLRHLHEMKDREKAKSINENLEKMELVQSSLAGA